MDDDPRPVLSGALDAMTSADLPRLAGAWTPALADELAACHLILEEHERGDLSHVLGPVLDRIPELAAFVTEDELLTGAALDTAERALDVLEGAVIAVHAADLLPIERCRRLAAPWVAAREQSGPTAG
jgi:hypothetical protein